MSKETTAIIAENTGAGVSHDVPAHIARPRVPKRPGGRAGVADEATKDPT
jgi:hypothetical protein